MKANRKHIHMLLMLEEVNPCSKYDYYLLLCANNNNWPLELNGTECNVREGEYKCNDIDCDEESMANCEYKLKRIDLLKWHWRTLHHNYLRFVRLDCFSRSSDKNDSNIYSNHSFHDFIPVDYRLSILLHHQFLLVPLDVANAFAITAHLKNSIAQHLFDAFNTSVFDSELSLFFLSSFA